MTMLNVTGLRRLIQRVANWHAFRWIVGIGAVLAAGLCLLWFYRDNQGATVLILCLMIGGIIAIPIAARRKWYGFWWVAAIVAVFVIGVFLSWLFWEDLRGKQDSLSTTVRSLGFVTGGIIAIVLAVWRSIVAERQAQAAQQQAVTAQKQAQQQAQAARQQIEAAQQLAQQQAQAAQQQIETAQQQARTAQQSLLNERYQRGAEMLGHNVLSVRLGGIYALERLAAEYPEQYHIQIMKVLCAFIRHPTDDTNFPEQPEEGKTFVLREDVQAAMRVVGARGNRHLRLAGKGTYHIDLHGADLRGGELRSLDLSSPSPDMIRSMPTHQAFTNPALRTDLSGARLHGADFLFTEISGVDFSRNGESPATGLTVSQLLGAQWDDANPPTLKDLVDILTGKPLVLPKHSSHKNQELEG